MMPRNKYLEISHSRHGRTTYYFRRARGHRVRLPDDYGSPSFWGAYQAAMDGDEPLPPPRPPKGLILRGRIGKTIEQILRAARTRARADGQPFDLDYEWAITQIEAQQFRCALTGIQFYSRFDGTCRVHPFGPSIDRIIPKGGYVRTNVRIVCFAVNVMLMDWGEPVFQTVANHYRAHGPARRRAAIPHPPTPQPMSEGRDG